MAKSLMSAIVELRPDMDAFRKEAVKGVTSAIKDVESKLETGMSKAGESAGRKAGDGIGEGIEKGVGESSKRAGKKMESTIGEAADRAGRTAAERTAKMSSMGNKLTLGVTAPVVLGFKNALDAFANYQDNLGALEVNYGENAAAISTWADTTASSYYIARDSALALANGLAPLIKNFVSADEAAATTTTTIARAGDIASMFGGSVDDAAVAIQSFLSGSSTEPIRRYGVFASEAAVKLKAMELGLVSASVSSADLESAQVRLQKANQAQAKALKENGEGSLQYRDAAAKVAQAEEAITKSLQGKMPELTEGQKIQARHALLMEQTAQAEGDAARTSDFLANKQKAATQAMRDASIAAGESLAPAMTNLLGGVADVANVFNGLPSGVQNSLIALLGIAAAVGPILKVVAAMRQLAAANALVRMSSVGGGLGGGLAGAGTAAGGSALAATGMSVAGTVAAGAAAFAGGYLIAKESGFADWAGEKLGNGISSLIPGQAEGGVTMRPGMSWVGEQGPELLSLPRGAEVRPLDKIGSGDTYHISVTVTGRAADDPAALARELDSLARRAKATQGRTRRPGR